MFFNLDNMGIYVYYAGCFDLNEFVVFAR